MKISHSPVLEIPGFLRRPFIKGKLVKHPIPDDPAESIQGKVRPDQGTEGMDLLVCPTTVLDRSSHNRVWRCDVRRPALAHESDDHADLSHTESEFRRSFPNHLGLHRSIYFLDPGRPVHWRVGQGAILDGAQPNCRSTEPTGICGRRKMGKVPPGGSAQDPGPEFLYSVLGRCRLHAPSVIRTAGGSANDGSSASDASRQCASRVCLHSSEGSRGAGKPQDMKLLPTRSSLSTRS